MKVGRLFSGSLRAKLLLTLMLVALFTSVTIGALFTVYELNTVTNTERVRLDSIANILAPNITAAVIFQDEDTVDELLKPLLRQSNIINARVKDVNGELFVEVVSDKHNNTWLFTDTMVLTTPLKMDGIEYGALEIKADYSLVEKNLIFFGIVLVGILILILALSFVLALFLRKNLIQPLIHLASVASRITNTSNYSLRVNVLSVDEVGNLANCFNLMLETIEQRERSLEIKVQQRTKALKIANNKLVDQANNDSLSGLPNRRYILDKLANLISCNKAVSDSNFAVLGLDLDGFKDINDTMGHDYGDLLLIAVGRRIANVLPDAAILARLGGDEFIVVIENIQSRVATEVIVKDIKDSVAKCFAIKVDHIHVTTSIGVALFPEDGCDVETLVKHADIAMYKSKESGRNCYHFFDSSMLDNLVKKHELIEDLRNSLNNGEFELYYQAITDLSSGKLCKAEALIRWNHPVRGLVSPIEFIEVAEGIGLIRDIGEWVARTAARDLADIFKMGVDNFQVSINASPLQFKGDGQWILNWFDYLSELGVKQDAIIVEITENLLMESEELVRSNLTKVKDHGISIAIDDFGVGYSSLSYLQKMDVDILKIDKSFVDDIATDANSRDLCRAMIMMAHNLDIQVVAEGIEDEVQKQILTEFGCDFGQGYLFSKPLPLTVFKEKYFKRVDKNNLTPTILNHEDIVNC